MGHCCYLFQSKHEKLVFTGDFLFMCGVGKFFEGNAKMKWESIETFKQRVDPSTYFFHAHEYALRNIEFQVNLDPKNKEL